MIFTRFPNSAFSLLELVVVVAVVSVALVISIPIYKSESTKVDNSQIVNKMGNLKLRLIDSYIGTGHWPTSLNNADSNTINASTEFANTTNFNYTTEGNQALYGYQLDEASGGGWIFMLLVANSDGSFASHCGQLDSSCEFGACESAGSFPSTCDEVITEVVPTAPLPNSSGTGGGD